MLNLEKIKMLNIVGQLKSVYIENSGVDSAVLFKTTCLAPVGGTAEDILP